MDKWILIVDDDASTAFFLSENLAEMGPAYHVETAGSGEEALGKIATHPFDLVITDLRMPGMSGLELLEQVRAGYPQTRLILMTAYGSEEIAAQAGRLGACRYIAKPFRVEKLLEAVRQALNGQSGRPEGPAEPL